MRKQRKKLQGKRDTFQAAHRYTESQDPPESKAESLHTTYSSSFVKCSARQIPTQTDPDQMQDVSVTNSLVYAFHFNADDIKLLDNIPLLIDLTPTESIRVLGELLKITDYEFNYSSFWNIDTLAGILREAQRQGLTDMCQKRIIEWFAFIIKKISIEGCTRDELFKMLEEMFLKASRIIIEGNDIPSPYDLIPKEIKIIIMHEDSDNKSEEMQLISLSSKKSSEENRRSDLTNTLKPPSEEMFFKRKRKQSQSVPAIPATSLTKRKLTTGTRKRRRSTSLLPYVKVRTSDDNNRVESRDTEQKDKDQEASKRFDEFTFIIKKIYDVFADEFKYSVIKIACHDPAVITPVDVCHSFKVPKMLKSLSSPLKQIQLSGAKVTSPKGKKNKGVKSKKGKKEKKGKSKTALPEETVEVINGKETKADNKRKQGKKKSGRVEKMPATSEGNTGTENIDKDSKAAVLTSGISKLQADISEKKLSPEQLMEIEKQRTKDMYILPLVDAVDSRFFEKIFCLKSTGKQNTAEDNNNNNKKRKPKKTKEKGKDKRDKSKKKKGK